MTENAAPRTPAPTIDTPPGWTPEPDLARRVGARLVVLGPTAGGFTSNLVLATSSIANVAFDDWVDGTDAVLDRTLCDYLLVDRAVELPAQAPGPMSDPGIGVRRIATYATDDGVDVTFVQRSIVRGDTAATVTVTVPTADYPQDDAVIADILTSLRWGA